MKTKKSSAWHAARDVKCQADKLRHLQQVLEVVDKYEQGELIVYPQTYEALEQQPITLVAFSCLAALKGKQELRVDLFETFFFKKFFKRAKMLTEELRSTGSDVTLTVILPDMEPIRTWGWEVPQEDITTYCQVMAEEAEVKLPEGWSVKLWSELEAEFASKVSYNPSLCSDMSWVSSVRKQAYSLFALILKGETDYIRNFSSHFPEITTKGDAEEIAIRQMAAYAHEGCILEYLFPKAVLLQSDFPAKRKDKMFGCWRGGNSLPIIHPFKLE